MTTLAESSTAAWPHPLDATDTAADSWVDNWVDNLVQRYILDQWELQDEPEHLRTISDRLWYEPHRLGQRLGLYQQVLAAQQSGGAPVRVDHSALQADLLLLGLVEKRQGELRVKNRIYEAVFNPAWVQQQLDTLRPYAPALNAWISSNYTDDSRLLRGQALRETLDWAQRQSLDELDYRFLAASQELDRQDLLAKAEAVRLQEVEARLEVERQRGQEQRHSLTRQRILLGEWRSPAP